jgi:phytoene dehydrogenase-like protein
MGHSTRSGRHVIVIGGGLAGLSAACYARASGFRTTIVEHNTALGGVCTAWPRGPYLVDGCIHWLTGGMFSRFYRELGILPTVEVRTIEHWLTWREGPAGRAVAITRDLAAVERDLLALAPEDRDEARRLVEAAGRFADLQPPGVDTPPELTTFREAIHAAWEMRGAAGTLLHFRKPSSQWAAEHLRSDVLRRLFSRIVPGEAPALFLLMVLGYLQRGELSRPVGGTAAFRDALVATYRAIGGETVLHATVDEILVEGGRARGVRLGDGSQLDADAVISTASGPETVLRLLGGRYGADATRERMKTWRMCDPIALVSFGVASPLSDLPGILLVDGLEPFLVGGRRNDHLYLRLCNDDPALAPPGHAVVQAMLTTDYAWWATRGTEYQAAKEQVCGIAIEQINRAIPGVAGLVRMTDVATPLTYWRQARSWRGAFEGWMPTPQARSAYIRKKLPGLDGFYMGGQWVEPGGGVPMAVLSGRQAAQLLCADAGQPFVAPR